MRTKYLFLFLTAALLLNACYKDKGNYNYIQLPNFYVDTAGTTTSFSVIQNINNISITPKIVYGGNVTELKGQWRLYIANGVFDTLSRNLKIDTVTNRAPGSYTLEFEATAPNGLKALMQYSITVLPPGAVLAGWMVAYERNGGTDVDVIRAQNFMTATVAQDTVYRNVYSSRNGLLPGKPVAIYYTSAALTHIYTTETGTSVQNADFRRAQEFWQLFAGTSPETYKPEGFSPGSFNGAILVNNSKILWSDALTYVGEVTPDALGYEAAPFAYVHFGQQCGFFDKKNRRFLFLQQQTSVFSTFQNADPAARFNLNNIGKDILWIERGFGQNTPGNADVYKYAFLKDITGNGRHLYVINTQQPSGRPDVAAVDISSAPEITAAKFYAASNLGPACFYGTGKTLYYFQVNTSANTISTPVTGFTAPAGEEITCVKLQKGIGTFGVSSVVAGGIDSKYMFIATWNEQAKTGKIYLYEVNVTSGQLSSLPLRVWDIAGKVGDMWYKRT